MKAQYGRKVTVARAISIITVVCLLLLPLAAMAAKPDGGETAGNNLSFPVIWAEGVTKALPGTAGMTPVTTGEWWYWWGTSGTDPNIVPLSCPPDPDNQGYCDDGLPNQWNVNDPPGAGWVKAYVQKDIGNVWQAESADWSQNQVTVDWIDWGDNLESVDWYTKSQVRTEVVLYQDLYNATTLYNAPMLAYEMRHVDGWGITEVHGLAVDNGVVMEFPSKQATVYSPCARLTIQKLLVSRDDPDTGEPNPVLDSLVWNDTEKVWTGEGLVNPPIFNNAVYDGGDGPGYYSAEINVKGKIIYGYTWSVRKLNDSTVNGGDAAGDYRVTFSFDDSCGTSSLNTFFMPAEGDDPGTQLMLPIEEEEVTVLAEDEGGDTGGATAVLDYDNNLTYIDVRILQRTGGGKGGGNAGGKGDDTSIGIGAGGGNGNPSGGRGGPR